MRMVRTRTTTLRSRKDRWHLEMRNLLKNRDQNKKAKDFIQMFGGKFSLNQTNRHNAIKICRQSNWQIYAKNSGQCHKQSTHFPLFAFFWYSVYLRCCWSILFHCQLLDWYLMLRGIKKSVVPPYMTCVCVIPIPYFIDGVERHTDYITRFKSCAKNFKLNHKYARNVNDIQWSLSINRWESKICMFRHVPKIVEQTNLNMQSVTQFDLFANRRVKHHFIETESAPLKSLNTFDSHR